MFALDFCLELLYVGLILFINGAQAKQAGKKTAS
jgi:hypothetical protein